MADIKDKNDLIKNGQGYIHETMDRVNIINSNLDTFVLQSPACDHLPEVKDKVEKAISLLSEAYQDLGQYWE